MFHRFHIYIKSFNIRNISIITIICLPFLFLCNSCLELCSSNGKDTICTKITVKPDDHNKFFFRYLPIRDTIYVLSDTFVELNFGKQTATVISRDGDTVTFKISSGTSRVPKGLDTPEGIFTVQSMSPKAISKQFNDAELFHWVGFNGGIGFHGLKGTGYYGTLGVRPSSHGCVRISNENAAKLYKMVDYGTPIIAFYGEPARVFAFIDSSDIDYDKDIFLEKRGYPQYFQLKDRLKYLYNGTALRNNKEKIILDGSTILNPGGYDVGRVEKIPEIQKYPYYFLKFKM